MDRSPRALRSAASGVMGLLSLACGASLLLSPRRVGRLFGLPPIAWLNRAIGARDMAIGLAMVARPEGPGGLIARALSDALDVALMTGSVAARGKPVWSIGSRLAVGALSAVTASGAAAAWASASPMRLESGG